METQIIHAHQDRVRDGWHDPLDYDDRPRRSWFASPAVLAALLGAIGIGVVVAVIVVVGLGSDDDDPALVADSTVGAQAAVAVQQPQPDSVVTVGDVVQVQALASHPDGVQRVELSVDGQFINSQQPDLSGGGEPPTEFSATIDWTPEEPRPYQLVIGAVSPDGERVDNRLTVTAVVPPDSIEPAVIAAEPVRVREYPSTDENILIYGDLQPNERRPIISRLASNEWLLVEFPASPSGEGWVFAQSVATEGDLESVPVVEAPVAPTPTPTATPTETPTATPTETATPAATEFDLQPTDFDASFGVEIVNNGPGDFTGPITLFYLTADTAAGCLLDTQSGFYTIDNVNLPAGHVLSVRFDVAPPAGLFCVGIGVEGEAVNTNNAIGPFQESAPQPTPTPTEQAAVATKQSEV